MCNLHCISSIVLSTYVSDDVFGLDSIHVVNTCLVVDAMSICCLLFSSIFVLTFVSLSLLFHIPFPTSLLCFHSFLFVHLLPPPFLLSFLSSFFCSVSLYLFIYLLFCFLSSFFCSHSFSFAPTLPSSTTTLLFSHPHLPPLSSSPPPPVLSILPIQAAPRPGRTGPYSGLSLIRTPRPASTASGSGCSSPRAPSSRPSTATSSISSSAKAPRAWALPPAPPHCSSPRPTG